MLLCVILEGYHCQIAEHDLSQNAVFLGVVLTACGFDSPSLKAGGTTVGTSTSKLTQVSSLGSNPGNLTMFEYVAAKVAARNVPVVVAMHGCTQSASAYVMAGWNTLADSIGAIIVYPQTAANGNCFAWFDPANARRGAGQALSVVQMVDSIKPRYPVSKVYVTGLWITAFAHAR